MIALSMVGKFGISGVYGEVFIYTGELFPTVVRSFVIAVCSFGGRIGSNTSPYMFRLVSSEYHFCIKKYMYLTITPITAYKTFLILITCNVKKVNTHSRALIVQMFTSKVSSQYHHMKKNNTFFRRMAR